MLIYLSYAFTPKNRSQYGHWSVTGPNDLLTTLGSDERFSVNVVDLFDVAGLGDLSLRSSGDEFAKSIDLRGRIEDLGGDNRWCSVFSGGGGSNAKSVPSRLCRDESKIWRFFAVVFSHILTCLTNVVGTNVREHIGHGWRLILSSVLCAIIYSGCVGDGDELSIFIECPGMKKQTNNIS